MKTIMIILFLMMFLLAGSASATDSPLKVSFLEACDASPHVDEGSNCMCVFNEVVHKFGKDDAKELIPFINGDLEMEREIGDSLSFIAGKCES